MSRPPLKVLCITGWCRNGSTIIGNILDEIPGLFHVGELHFLWMNAAGKGSNNLCGCGTELVRCPVWSQILRVGRPIGVSAAEFADTVISRQQACVRTRHTWRVLRHELAGEQIRQHAALMTEVYHAVAARTGASVIVDTNKLPAEAALLPYLDGVIPYYLHLVRDPRSTAQSWSRQKQYAHVMPSWQSTAYWQGFNLAARAVTRHHSDRSLFVRYEDFIAHPAGAIDATLRLCGVETSANPMQNRTVELHPNHTVTGNPDRFLSGPTVIRDRDMSWHGLPTRSKLAAVTLSWPLFHRYGYHVGGTFRTTPGLAEAAARTAAEPSSRQ